MYDRYTLGSHCREQHRNDNLGPTEKCQSAAQLTTFARGEFIRLNALRLKLHAVIGPDFRYAEGESNNRVTDKRGRHPRRLQHVQ